MMDREDRCSYCGGSTREDLVKSCLWEGGSVFLMEDIPARVCEKCYEQFYDEETVARIEKLRRDGFPRGTASRVIEVPVFSLSSPEKPAGRRKRGKRP